jgi:hypothetical protein
MVLRYAADQRILHDSLSVSDSNACFANKFNMQEFLIEPHILSTSGLLDPEQFETHDHNRNPYGGLKPTSRNDTGTLSPWQVTHKPRIQLKEKI